MNNVKPDDYSTTLNEIICGRRILHLPCFFASVSSVKTNFTSSDYVSFLERFGFPNYLVSAYDLIAPSTKPENQLSLIIPSATRDSIILLDSGNYEAFWLRDRNWDRSSYLEAVELADADFVFSFDDPWNNKQSHKFPRINPSRIIPIVHGDPDNLPARVMDIAQISKSFLIGVPERELGDGIVQRASTLREMHLRLREGEFQHRIHLLGTGNPLSILLYVSCGASSFDGLEWCQTTVERESARLLHFSQRELTSCTCSACQVGGSYSAITLGHNLLFYIDWMERIRAHLETNSINNLLEEYFSPGLLKKIKLGWEND